jgi:hypothetical protein
MSTVLRRLGEAGAAYRDPVAAVDWLMADPDLPWLPPSLASLGGIIDGQAPSGDFMHRFSRSEFARLCAAGLWLEGLLISRVTTHGFLAHRVEEARIMLQEVREESGHGLMFLEMIERAGLSGVQLLGPTGLLTWIAHRLDPDDADFWAMVFIGESVTDAFAVRALKESEGNGNAVCLVARQVLTLHHRDEARHIAAARVLLEERIARMGSFRRLVFARTLRFLLKRFLIATLYPTPASLAALGVENPQRAARRARTCPERRRLAEACAQPALDLLARTGLIRESLPGHVL